MLPVQTIIHATDFSTQSEYALQLASAIARDYGARLVILHVAVRPTIVFGEGVVPSAEVSEESREQLNRLELPRTDVRAERRFVEGDPATEIVRVAHDEKADLIVLGTHGRSGLERLLMGSVAEHVLRAASCPVLTVKSPVREKVEVNEPALAEV